MKFQLGFVSRILISVISLLAMILFASCGVKTGNLSSGKYWSFIDGSKEHYVDSADPVGANLKVNYEAPTDYLEVSQFDVYLDMQSGPTKEVRLYPLIPDNVSIIDDSKVQLIMTRSRGLLPESDNPRLSNDLQSVVVTVEEVDSGSFKNDSACSPRYKTQNRHYEERYDVTINLYDLDILERPNPVEWKGHMMGTFEGKISFRSKTRLVSCYERFDVPSTGIESGKGMYNWLVSQANALAEKKAKK